MIELVKAIAGVAEAFWDYTVHGMEAAVQAMGYLLASFQLGNVLAPFLPTIIGASVTAVIAIGSIRILLSVLP